MQLVLEVTTKGTYAKAMRGVRKETQRTKKPMSDLKKLAGGLFAGFSAAIVIRQLKQASEALGRFVGGSVILAAEQAAAFALVEQTIRSTGGAAGLSADEISDMAKELQDLTGIGDEVILTYANMALTFTNLSKDVFPEVLERALDIAQTMGTSVKESLVQVAKATNDPIGGLGTLSRVGIQFTQDQKDMAKQLVETGDIMGAQRIILDELEKQFGGASRAARDTLPGALKALQAVSGDLQEVLGEDLRPEIRGLVEDMIAGVEGSEDLAEALGTQLAAEVRDLKPLVEDLAGATQLFARLLPTTESGTSSLTSELAGLFTVVQKLRQLAALNEIIQTTADNEEAFADALDHANKSGTLQVEFVKRYSGGVLDVSKRLTGAALAADQWRQGMIEAGRVVEEAAKAAAKVSDALERLQSEVRESEAIVDLMDRTGVSAEDAAVAIQVLLSEGNKASEEQVLALVEALNAAREAADLAENGLINLMRSNQQLRQQIAERQSAIADELMALDPDVPMSVEIVFDTDQVVSDMQEVAADFGAGLEASLLSTVGPFETAMRNAMKAAGAVLMNLASQVADAFVESLGGVQQTGVLGGQSEGTFAQEGAQAGEIIGGIFGPGWAEVGKIIGGFLGDFVKKGADDAMGEISFATGEAIFSVRKAEGALAETFGPLGDAFADLLNSAVSSLGGVLSNVPDIDIEFRSGEFIKFWGRRFDATVEGIDEALAFAVIQVLTQSDVTGVEPEVVQALESFVGNTLEGFNEAMALAMRLAEGRIGPEATRVRQALESAFADLEAGVSAGIDVQGGIANLQRFRDQLLGLEQDLGAQKAAEIDAYNAAIDMEILRIQVLGLELEAMESNLQGRLGGVQELAEIVGVENDLNTQRIESMAAVAEATAGAIQAEGARVAAMAAATQVTVEMATGTAEVLARVAGVLADLEALRITGAERAAAIARAAAGRARRAGGGGQSEEERLAEAREREAEALRATNLEIIRAASFGSQYHEQLANINRDFEAQLETLGPLNLEHEDYLNALRAQGILVEQLTDDAYASLGSRTLSLMDEMDQLGETLSFLIEQGDVAHGSMDRLGIAIRDKVVSVLSGSLSFLSSAVEHIQGPAERLAAQEAIARLQAEFWAIEFRFMELKLRLLFREIELAGELDAQTAAWFETVFGIFDTLGDNLADVVDSMAEIPDQIVEAGNALAAGLAPLALVDWEAFSAAAAGISPGVTVGGIGGQLAQFMQTLLGLENQSGTTDPIQQLQDQLQFLGPFFAAFGLSLEDVTARLDELSVAAAADQLASGMLNLQDILDSIVSGPLSFLSPNAQANAQLDQITSLFATAGGSDTAAAAAAVAELGQILPGFLGPGGLGAQGFGAAFNGIQDIIQAQLEALGLTPSSFGDSPPGSDDPFGGDRIVFGIDTSNSILREIRDGVQGGNRQQAEFNFDFAERLEGVKKNTAATSANLREMQNDGPKA